MSYTTDGYCVSYACEDGAHDFCDEQARDDAGELTSCECDCHPYMRADD